MRLLLTAAFLGLLTSPVLAQSQPRPHNVVLFIADGLRQHGADVVVKDLAELLDAQ